MDLSNLPGILDGDLDPLIDVLIQTDQAERLQSVVDDEAVTPVTVGLLLTPGSSASGWPARRAPGSTRSCSSAQPCGSIEPP